MQPEFRSAQSKAEIEQALEVLYLAFPNTPPEYFQKHQWQDPTLSFEDTYLALMEGKIASVVQVFPRTMMVRKKPVPLAGIGNVGTHPDYRGLGLSSGLMRKIIAEMSVRGYWLSMLFTQIHDYFAQFGYQIVDRNEFFLHPVAEPIHGDLEIFNQKRDLQELLQLYAEFSAKRTGALQRDQAYWQGQLVFANDTARLFTLLRRQGRIVAYVRCQQKNDVLRIMEHGYSDSVFDFFSLASRVARKQGVNKIRVSLSPEEVLQAPDPIPMDPKHADDFIMICVTSCEEFVQTFHLWDDEPASIVEALFGAGEFTYWETDFF